MKEKYILILAVDIQRTSIGGLSFITDSSTFIISAKPFQRIPNLQVDIQPVGNPQFGPLNHHFLHRPTGGLCSHISQTGF